MASLLALVTMYVGGKVPKSDKLRIERARYAIKRLVQTGAGGLHRNDDHDRNSSSDETILDGGHARGVFQET